MKQSTPTLAVVVPLFNEAASLGTFHCSLTQALAGIRWRSRIYYVDDGSWDETPRLLEELARDDSRVVVIGLSRNFGHQAALAAGLDAADGDAILTMDGDGQHPPSVIEAMLAKYQEGYDIVLAQRAEGQGGSVLKGMTSRVFYWLLNRISDTQVVPGAADFRLLSRAVLEALRAMPEYHRFLRGMVAWMGFRTAVIPYLPGKRIAGRSGYSLRKMIQLAAAAVFSFSLVPLHLALALGLLFLVLAAIEAVYVLSFWIAGRQDLLVPGWSSLMFMLLIVGGVMMVGLGIVGVYVGYVFQEVKGRPVYLIRYVYPAGPSRASELVRRPRRRRG